MELVGKAAGGSDRLIVGTFTKVGHTVLISYCTVQCAVSIVRLHPTRLNKTPSTVFLSKLTHHNHDHSLNKIPRYCTYSIPSHSQSKRLSVLHQSLSFSIRRLSCSSDCVLRILYRSITPPRVHFLMTINFFFHPPTQPSTPN